MYFWQKSLVEFHEQHVHLPRVSRVADAIVHHIEQADSLLDIGCGTGEIARMVADRVGASEVMGVDVKVRQGVAIPVIHYGGIELPFPDQHFDFALLSDVLHHCTQPEQVLLEALRVVRKGLVIKDHICFGTLSKQLLLLMDLAGNWGSKVDVAGTYWTLPEWVAMITRCEASFSKLTWPLKIHDFPFRMITRSELQFVATIVKNKETIG
jgi:ubiquinone/menaquinone biosynthesis C-methylase UbiE